MSYRQAVVWQKSMGIAREVYGLTPGLPSEERYGMRSQITRAAVSIPANVAEGWSRETRKDKAHFFTIAQGSLAETETLLTLCEDFGWFSRDRTEPLRGLLEEVSRMLTTLRRQGRQPS